MGVDVWAFEERISNSHYAAPGWSTPLRAATVGTVVIGECFLLSTYLWVDVRIGDGGEVCDVHHDFLAWDDAAVLSDRITLRFEACHVADGVRERQAPTISGADGVRPNPLTWCC